MGGGNSVFSRVSGKGGSTREKLPDWQKSFPFVQNKTAATEVALAGIAAGLTTVGVKRFRARKAAMAPEGATRAPKTTGVDVVFNSWTKGPKREVAPPSPAKPLRVTNPDAPINQVKGSFPENERRFVRNTARTIFDLNFDPTKADYSRSPASPKGGVPKRRKVRAPAAPFVSDYKPQVRTFDPMVGKAPAPAKPALTQTGYSMKKSLAARFAVPTPKETPAPKAAATPKAEKPSSVKVPTPKAPAATTVEIKAPAMIARAFQPGKLEGETRVQTKARHVAEHAADNAAKRAEKKKVEPKNKTKAPTSAKPPSPAAVEKVSAPRTSLTAAERKAAKDAKSAENRRVHAENQAREREARKAAKAAGGKASGSGFHNTPQPPPSPTGVFNPNPQPPPSQTGVFNPNPQPPSGEFKSKFKPQVRTFDPMVGQKQYGLKSKPYNDSPEAHRRLVEYGMRGRTGDDQRPKHVRNAAGKMIMDSGPYSVEGTKKATSPMFPGGTVSNPQSNQPHMTGKGAKVVGEQGNFRVWQGPRRSETIVEHRTGRQVSLSYNPNKHEPVNTKAILAYANKGDNEKAFLAGGFSVDSKLGKRNRTARFTLGASRAGGLLSAGGLAAYGIGKLLGPAGTLIGPTNAAAAPSTPGRYYAKQASREPNRAARNSLQRKAVEADRFREGKTASFVEPSKYKSIVKKYGYSPFGNYADVVSTSGAFAKRYPNIRYKAKK